MGAVWQAQDEVLHRTVAIKQLLLQPGLDAHEAEDARQRTMREARLAARLHHPNAITVFDVVTDHNGRPCLIMEYLKSASLAEELQERKTLTPREVAKIGAQVAAALKDAHAAGIVHRDIKPGNILLTSNGQVKITDFGISRAVDDVTVTRTGMIAGTPAYLAPEVAVGGNPGPESDIFSLGSTLYAACEGQPPFGLSENTLGLLHAVAGGQIIPPRRSGTLTSVLAVLLHPDTRHRPTAEEAEELLSAVARGETPLGGPAEETVLAPSTGRLGGSSIAGAGAAGAAFAVGQRMPPHGYYDEAPAAKGGYGEYNAGYEQPYGDGYSEGYANEYDDRQYESDPRYANREYVPTRAHSQVTEAYDYDDEYDDYGHGDGHNDGHGRDHDDYEEPSYPEEETRRGQWRKPVLIASLVALALVAFGFWIFSPKNSAPVGGSTTTSVQSTPTSSLSDSTNNSGSETSSTSTESSTSSTSESSHKTSSNAPSKSQSEQPNPPVSETPDPPSAPTKSSTTSSSPAGSGDPGPSNSGSNPSP
jgi:serine/threonine protein kinase